MVLFVVYQVCQVHQVHQVCKVYQVHQVYQVCKVYQVNIDYNIGMKIINKALLDETTRRAKENPRLRMNYNLHDSLDAKAQKLLNALEPGTKLPVHRHQLTSETYVCCEGS